ncbi:MAG: ABC transporter ATP-binding protein [Terracidiphilus sp.]|jgi:lipoprotein-releasing system ATP-binding protein
MIKTSPTIAGKRARTARETKPRAKAGKTPIIPPIIQVRNLEKTYTTARGSLTLFQGLSLDVKAGEMVAIVGQSGAGKSTLLHILGALDAPTAGTVTCASVNVAQLSPQEAAAFRNREIGYVWQFHYLLPEFTALENVAMPLLARGVNRRAAMDEAANWLREVDLADRGSHRPGELSGGEQQRVALARALVNNPRLLLADEPTGDLDAITAGRVFDLIERLHKTHGLTSIVVTHNMELAARAKRVLRLESGILANGRLAPPAAYTPQTGPRAAKKRAKLRRAGWF